MFGGNKAKIILVVWKLDKSFQKTDFPMFSLSRDICEGLKGTFISVEWVVSYTILEDTAPIFDTDLIKIVGTTIL